MRSIVLAMVVFAFGIAGGEEDEKVKEEPKPSGPTASRPTASKPIAFLDIPNAEDGSYPGGATPKKGKWKVDKTAKKIKVAPEPLYRGWLEFGPEIRVKGSTIIAKGRSPGLARIKSRFGVGLYGENGFQLEAVPATGEVELIRRGAVLAKAMLPLDVEKLYFIELAVIEEDENWRVTGRVWEDEAERPGETLISHKIFAEELLFPLAGRPVLTATPFSGEEVQFASAKVYDGKFIPEPVVEEVKLEEDQKQDKEQDQEGKKEEGADE